MNLLGLIRYRFFLFAGMLPFLLGQAIAYGWQGMLDWGNFWWGFSGIFLVLIAVEFFNEYFDAKVGGDRIFSWQNPNIPHYFFPLGILAVGLAFMVGIYLTFRTDWPVLVFSFLGFLACYFYVGPPLRWAYRGLGETVIALSYGPVMVLGSFYIQTQEIAFVPFFASVICGLSMFSLAVLNEIPDYYQDMLVGKKNLVVRLGKSGVITLLKCALSGVFVLLVSGIVLGKVPPFAIVSMVTIPWIWKGVKQAQRNYDNPKMFLFAVNAMVLSHVVLAVSLGLSFLKGPIQ